MKTPNLYRVDFKHHHVSYYFVAFSQDEADLIVRFGLQQSVWNLRYSLHEIHEIKNHDVDDDVLSFIYISHRCDGEPLFHSSIQDLVNHHFCLSSKNIYTNG